MSSFLSFIDLSSVTTLSWLSRVAVSPKSILGTFGEMWKCTLMGCQSTAGHHAHKRLHTHNYTYGQFSIVEPPSKWEEARDPGINP